MVDLLISKGADFSEQNGSITFQDLIAIPCVLQHKMDIYIFSNILKQWIPNMVQLITNYGPLFIMHH